MNGESWPASGHAGTVQRRGITTKGVGIRFLWGDVIALGIYATVAMTLVAITFRKRLD